MAAGGPLSCSCFFRAEQQGLELLSGKRRVDRLRQQLHLRDKRARLGNRRILAEGNEIVMLAVEQRAKIGGAAGKRADLFVS